MQTNLWKTPSRWASVDFAERSPELTLKAQSRRSASALCIWGVLGTDTFYLCRSTASGHRKTIRDMGGEGV